jgi:aspartyl-tRNA(Asn)/glutamyl-tRNA(Gln) amidotransferase subunit A
MARTVADTALLLQAIAGYDEQDTTSEKMSIPDYSHGLEAKTSYLRIGVPREFFFADLDPEIEAAMKDALSVLGKLTAGIRDVALRANTMESLRNTVRAAESYTYHRDFVARVYRCTPGTRAGSPNGWKMDGRYRYLGHADPSHSAVCDFRSESG